jgi:hypothetical protein
MSEVTGLRVFVSATTADLGECRRRVAEALAARGQVPVTQERFPPDPRELAALLEGTLKTCHAVLLLVGFGYGRKVPEPHPFSTLVPPEWGGCSYTQLEYLLTVHWRKPLYLFFVTEGSALDREPDDEARARQKRYREHVATAQRQVRHPIASVDDAVAAVARIDFGAVPFAPVPWPNGAEFDRVQPALPPRFVGRELELRELEDALVRSAGVSLVGDTRIGKTSLLKTWEARARAFGRTVVYVDGQARGGGSEKDFVEAVTGQRTGSTPDQAAESLALWARSLSPPPLVLVDEGDSLIRQASVRFFERLRALVGNQEVVVVLATRRDLAAAFQEGQQRGSPFGNNMEERRLGLLDPAAAQTLADRAGGHAPLLREWAGEHPFFLQLAGWHLQRRGDVDRGMADFREEAYVRLKEIWAGLGRTEREGLKSRLEGARPELFRLQRRGLLRADGRPFGRILQQWWIDDPQEIDRA